MEFQKDRDHTTKDSSVCNLPILEDIGWAIIDYLKNGRLKTSSPYLFVRHNAL
ncbi:hypothetical protein PB1_00275 [Bacillus methanolicus PB1]|uniref:Uncharacterized protein n=1 Tax=Bacillus methanolicus PB1 TaxID=997296 RepID=I3E4B3_BACMT|nr:hypothetical protein PB1_00275 [Bacillus methanolicus PB1]